MFFLNFGFLEFAMLAGAASLATVALYLLDRSRRRQVVSTLRFWTQARQPVQTQRRRRLQQPWSLLLQLLGILFLLLAIAQPRLGDPFSKPPYRVLVLETSAWMNAHRGEETLMDAARRRAGRWLATIPPGDPVMLIRADALATPATAFEFDHRRVAAAIAASQPGATALNLDDALAFARHVQSMQNVHGEIAFVGTGRIKHARDSVQTAGGGLRVILVPDAIQTAGLRRLNAKRSASDPAEWEVSIAVHNYGDRARPVHVNVSFDGAPIRAKVLSLPAGSGAEANFTLHSAGAGFIEAQLSPGDAFPEDDHAVLALPPLPAFKVSVYTAHPEALRPFFAANPEVQAQFRSPLQYRADESDSIWIDPQPGQSPVPIVRTVEKPRVIRWTGTSPLSTGLHAQDTRVAAVSVLQSAAGDIPVAEIDEGPVVIARSGAAKTVVFGFDPGASGLRYRLSMPLVFANILRWIHPESFRQLDFNVEAAGSLAVPLNESATPDGVEVTGANGIPVPFTLDHRILHFFSGSRENVRVLSQHRESVYALTLPEMWDSRWEIPSNALRGVPAAQPFAAAVPELWPVLAVLGAACLIADWFLFSGARGARLRSMPLRAPLRRAS